MIRCVVIVFVYLTLIKGHVVVWLDCGLQNFSRDSRNTRNNPHRIKTPFDREKDHAGPSEWTLNFFPISPAELKGFSLKIQVNCDAFPPKKQRRREFSSEQ